jgi:hypothetical protein
MPFDVWNDINSHNLRISNFFKIVEDPNPLKSLETSIKESKELQNTKQPYVNEQNHVSE